MLTSELHTPVQTRRPPTQPQKHAVFLIEQKVEEWQALNEALRHEESELRQYRAKHPNAVEHLHLLEAGVRLLQLKCDRALEGLGAAVGARRAFQTTERPYPPME